MHTSICLAIGAGLALFAPAAGASYLPLELDPTADEGLGSAPTPPPEPAQLEQPVHSAREINLATEVGPRNDHGRGRRVAEDFLVLPDGIDVGGALRTITAEDGLGTGKLRLTDLALLDLHAEWAFAHHFELDGAVHLLIKQPGAVSEPTFQGGSLTLRRDVVARTAGVVSASAAPLVALDGAVFAGSAFAVHKHRLNDIVSFSLAGGVDGLTVHARREADPPWLAEAAAHAAVLVRSPNGVWGGWFGAGYALPIGHRGDDPVTGRAIDPQPRLDLDLGSGVQLAPLWDLSVELSIVDRGDAMDPATRLPIFDGGFDQVQLTIGVSRRLPAEASSRSRSAVEPEIAL